MLILHLAESQLLINKKNTIYERPEQELRRSELRKNGLRLRPRQG